MQQQASRQKRNHKVDLGKFVQMYRAPFLYLPGAPNSLNPPLFVTCVLFCSLSAFVTNHATPTSYVIRVRQSAEVRKKCLLRLKYGYLSYKNAWIRYRRPLFTPRSRVKDVLLQMRALYFMSSELLTKNTHLPHWKAWRGQDNFLYNSDWFVWKKKVTDTYDALSVSKTQANFHFWVN